MKHFIQSIVTLWVGAATSGAAVFFTPVGVTSENSTAFYPISRLHQGPVEGFAATPPHDAVAGQTWVTNQPNGSGDYYANGVAAPVLVIDLGVDRPLAEISTWGYADGNANGVRSFNLRFATSAEGPGGFSSSIAGQNGFIAAASAVTRNSHPLVPVTARYVEFTATDNYRGYGNPGGDRVGLGEIAFEDITPPPDPRLNVVEALDLDLDGGVQTFMLEIGNTGAGQTLVLGTPSFTGPNAAAFTCINSPASIAPGGTEVMVFSFNPGGLGGDVRANLVLPSNDALAPTASVSLGGFLHDPRLMVAGGLDFGVRAPGSPAATLPLVLTNSGAGRFLSITGATLAGGDADHFSLGSVPAGIVPLGSASIPVSFDSRGKTGDFSARLTLVTNDAANPSVVVDLTARTVVFASGEGLRINEFMASNSTGLADGDGAHSDWIELHNAGPGSVDLAGWHLTDNAGNLTKWTFPSRTLAAGGYLVVFASGKPVPDYVDPGGNLHTNFSLGASGEYLGLVKPDGQTIVSEFHPQFPAQFANLSYGVFASAASTVNVIASSAPVVFAPVDSSLGLAWIQNSFIPGAQWITGTGQGIGYDNETTYLPYITTNVKTPMLSNSLRGLYIRLPFTVSDVSSITAMSLPISYDDGFVAYLNGTEIARRNAPASPVWNSLATGSPSPEPAVGTLDVTAFKTAIQNGANVLAIHGMNSSTTSSDFLIAPELRITTVSSTPSGTGYLVAPTPGAANSGSAAPGPWIASVASDPPQPSAARSTTITAAVSARLAPVAEVSLHYRLMFDAEITVAMLDNGIAPDTVAGDGIHAATIPAAVHQAGKMLRWYVTATDTAGNPGRAPAYLIRTGESQSAQYFGTVVPDPSQVSAMPVFEWFTQDSSASHSRTGTRASVEFAGRFYDNVFVRLRGGATNGTVSQKFDFNKDEPFRIDDSMPAVDEINLNGNGYDATYARQPLAFDTYRAAGNAACNSALWLMRLNSGADRVGVFVEQVDDSFLRRNHYDPEGDLYKYVGPGTLDPAFRLTTSGVEKKTGDKANNESFVSLVNGLNLPTGDGRRRFVIDQLDLPQVLNFLALRSITQDADDVRKNFYIYQDTRGDDRWRIFPWDKDWTFGITGDGGTWLPHPFFGDEAHAKQNANQWNVLYNVMFGETTTQRLYLRRLRTLMDTLLQPSSTPLAGRLLENRAAAVKAPAGAVLGTDVSSINAYLTSRRDVLFNTYASLIPASQPAAPSIAITGALANPPSGNQDHEYIVLHNNEATEIDISGWSLAGGVTFTFAPGTVIARQGDLYVSPDTLAFRNRPTSPTGNEEHLVVGPCSGHLSNFGEVLTLADPAGVVVSTFSTPYQPTDAQLHLVVSEIMYHPEPDGDAEFIELMNTGTTVTLDLSGFRFTDGIDYTFPAGTTVAPGARIVVAGSPSAFQAIYGVTPGVLGPYAPSSLDNSGETIRLEDAAGNVIFDFAYDDVPPWPGDADGHGSLVLIAPSTHPDPALPESWRTSLTANGNPGTGDALVFTGDPGGDSDGDGIANLVEYAMGENPVITSAMTPGGFSITLPCLPNADDAVISGEFSIDLVHWIAAETAERTADSVRFHVPAAFAGEGRGYLRGVVRLRQANP